jgi:hypothetical protein
MRIVLIVVGITFVGAYLAAVLAWLRARAD